MIWWIVAAVVLTVSWSTCAWYYSRIWHVRLKWWAVWMAHGALLLGVRLRPVFEVPRRDGDRTQLH